MWKDGIYQHYRCPVCRSDGYVRVKVQRPNGNWYTTEFYRCFGCSIMFTDPVQFSQCMPILRRELAIPGTRAWREMHGMKEKD